MYLDRLIGALGFLILVQGAWAQSGPASISLSGGLFQPNGSPILQTGVNFKIEIYDKSGSCLLYSEEHPAQDLSQTKGGFSLEVGRGVNASNLIDSASPAALSSKVFENTGVIAGGWAGCPSGVTLSSGDHRVIRMRYDLGGGYVAMNPDVPISSAAYAMVAETLQGLRPENFVQVREDATTELSQANLENIFSSVNYPKLDALVSGSAPVGFNNQRLTDIASPTAATDAATKGYADGYIGGKAADLSHIGPAMGDGETLLWDQAAQKWTTGTPSAMDITKLPLAGGTMTGAIDMGGQNILAAGHVILSPQKVFNFGTFDDTQEAALVATLTTAQKGASWYNSSSNVMKIWNGTSAISQDAAGGPAGGDLSGTYPNPSLADNAVTTPKLFANPGVNRLIATDSSSGATLTPFECSGTQIMQWSGLGWACTNVDSALGDAYIKDGGNSRSADISVGTKDNFGFTLQTNDTPRLTVDSLGKVGIGTTSPTAALDLRMTIDSTISDENMLTGVLTVDPTADSAMVNAGLNFTVKTTGSHNLGAKQGILGYVNNLSEGTTSSIAGTYGSADNGGAGTVTNAYGSVGLSTNQDQAGVITTAYGAYNRTWSASSTTSNIGTAYGSYDYVLNSGSGSINTAKGTYGYVRNSGGGSIGSAVALQSILQNAAGTITTGYGLYLNASNAGTMTNWYGIYIPAFSGTPATAARFPLYIADTNPSYLAGNVGIGTTAPTTKLEVNGTVKATSFEGPMTSSQVSSGAGSAASPSMTFSGDADTGFYNTSSNDTIGVSTGGTNIFNFSSTGLSSPTTGGANILTAAGSASNPTYGFAGDPGTGWFRPAASTLAASTGGTEKIRIDPVGNVGIGTTTPEFGLSVVGTTGTAGAMTIQRNQDAGAGPAILLRTARGNPGDPSAQTLGGQGIGAIYFRGTDENGNSPSDDMVAIQAFTEEKTTSSARGAGFKIQTTSIGSPVKTEKFRITANGNVGIGTTNPSSPLHISSNALGVTTPDQLMDRYSNDWTGPYTVTRKARGTPSSPLPVNAGDDIGGMYARGYGTTGFGANNIGAIKISAEEAFTDSAQGTRISFGTTPLGSNARAERMRITSAGNVGIGTASPSDVLTIVGSGPRITLASNDATNTDNVAVNFMTKGMVPGAVGTKRWQVFTGGDGRVDSQKNSMVFSYGPDVTLAPFLILKDTGNVGIGTITPSYKLDVNGTLNAKSTIRSQYRMSISRNDVGYAPYLLLTDQTLLNAVNGSNPLSSSKIAGSIQFRKPPADTSMDEVNGLGLAYVQAIVQTDLSGDLALGTYNSGGTGATNFYIKGASGNVGIGTTNPGASLDVRAADSVTSGGHYVVTSYNASGTAGTATGWYANGTSLTGGVIRSVGSLPLFLGTTNQLQAFTLLDTNGNVGIGTTGPSEKLHIVGNLRVQGSTDCTLGNGSGGTNCSSDIRLKTNVQEIQNSLEKILSLRGVEFDWNEKSQSPGAHAIGVIAQDVEKQFPTAVIEDSNTGYKKVDYAVLVAPLIQAFKELNTRITELFSASESHSRDIASLKSSDEAKAKELAAKDKEIAKLKADAAKQKQENAAIKAYLCAKDPKASICH